MSDAMLGELVGGPMDGIVLPVPASNGQPLNPVPVPQKLYPGPGFPPESYIHLYWLASAHEENGRWRYQFGSTLEDS